MEVIHFILPDSFKQIIPYTIDIVNGLVIVFYVDGYTFFYSILQIELVKLIKNPMQNSTKRYSINCTVSLIVLLIYILLLIFNCRNVLIGIRIALVYFSVIFSFVYSLYTIISLLQFINNTKTKIISLLLQIISFLLLISQVILSRYFAYKSYYKNAHFYFIFGLFGFSNISIVINYFLIFIFFSGVKSFFTKHLTQKISQDTEMGLLSTNTSNAPIFKFSILNYILTKNYIVIFEVIRTIAKQNSFNTNIKQIFGNYYVQSNEYICNIDNNNNVIVNKKQFQDGFTIKIGYCCEFKLFDVTRKFYKYSVIEHCPEIFHNIRLIDGITYDIINDSFNLRDNLPNLSELCQSEGKSGSLFFFTHNKKFILKTIPEREFKTFLDFATSYNSYLIEERFSFLVKIYGLYTISNSLSTFHIILMENISPFPSHRISYKFDLKGSLYERETKDLMKNRRIKALKDNDFLEISKSANEPLINISKENIQIILKTIQKDIQLLTKANLMDYSLYICIVNNSDDLDLPNNKYIRSIDNKYIYCIGIIDYLTSYKMRKVLEKRVKNLIHFTKKKTVFSVIEPILYQSRLFTFIKTKIFI